jgi:AraC-like DNA-binding protein
MAKSAFVSCSLADVLREYMEKNALDVPDVQRALDAWKGHQRMPFELFSQLLERVRQLHPVPALGLRIGRCATAQNFGVVGYLATSCSSLGQALMRYRRFQTLLATNLQIQVRQQGDTLQFHWGHGGEATTLLANEFGVAAFINLYQILIGQPLAPLAVEFPHPAPGHLPIYQVLLGCPVKFNSTSVGLNIPASILSLRIATGDPYLRNLLDQQASAMLLAQPIPDEFLTRLRQYIANALQEGEPSAAQVAAQMNYPLRSFYRTLTKRGFRYRTVLADVRFDLARLYLADSRLSAAEIALLLGYSEQSAFNRAFRGWTGSTPVGYRQSQRQKIS